MLVVCERLGDSQATHDRKGNVINNSSLACFPSVVWSPGGHDIGGRRID